MATRPFGVIERDEAQLLDAASQLLVIPGRLGLNRRRCWKAPPGIAGRGYDGIGRTATRPPAGSPLQKPFVPISSSDRTVSAGGVPAGGRVAVRPMPS